MKQCHESHRYLPTDISRDGEWRGSARWRCARSSRPALTAAGQAGSTVSRGIVNPLHHAAKAKRVIFLYQAGGPSHLETFDYKPKLASMNGEPMPESFTKGQQLAQLQRQKLMCFAPQYPFRRYGKSGQEMTEIFPHIGGVADELCIIRSMYGEQINHDPAHQIMNNGSILTGRPSFGSWLLYGLGSEAENLPGFVVMVSTGRGGSMQPIAARQWAAGILPSKFQGVKISSFGDPVSYIDNPQGISAAQQGESIDAIKALDQLRFDKAPDPEILTRISQYEMAFKMQTSVPDLVDFKNEPAERARRLRRQARRRIRTPPTACSRAGSPNAASVSSSSITATGITTPASRPAWPTRPRKWTGRRRRSSPI